MFAVIFGAAKRSLSLSMILMVCMGYGVVRPSLGQDIHKIMGMALVYFVSSAVSYFLCTCRSMYPTALRARTRRADVTQLPAGGGVLLGFVVQRFLLAQGMCASCGHQLCVRFERSFCGGMWTTGPLAVCSEFLKRKDSRLRTNSGTLTAISVFTQDWPK